MRRAAWRRDDDPALGLEGDELLRGDRLDLGDDQVRSLVLDDLAQRDAIQHVDDVRAVRDLHRRCVRVAIARDDLDAEPLQLDHDLLAELTGAEHQDARGIG